VYGFKGNIGYSLILNSDGTKDADYGTTSYRDVPHLASYTFETSGEGESYQTTIQNVNVFKRDPGVAGLVVDQHGTPVANVKVEIYDGTGKKLTTQYTDVDGFYSYYYKYTGKAATFTVKLPDYNQQKPVTLKSNVYVIVNFQITIL